MKNSLKYKKLSKQDCIQDIIQLKKELFNLRLKKATKQNVKSHMFKKTRRRLARLFTESSIVNLQ